MKLRYSLIRNGSAAGIALALSTMLGRSDPLASWSEQPSGTTTKLQGVAYGNGEFVAVGSSGVIVSSGNATNWLARTSGTTNHLHAVGFFNGQFVAVGDQDTILTSADGRSWVARQPEVEPPFVPLLGVASGAGQLIAVGGWGLGCCHRPIETLSSGDGWNWLRVGSAGDNTDFPLSSIVYGSDQFVMIGGFINDLGPPVPRSVIFSSLRGLTRTERLRTTNHLSAVTYGNNRFVVVGDGGVVETSSNVVAWVPSHAPITSNLQAVAYHNGEFIAVGTEGAIVTSEDGVTWVQRPISTTNALFGIAYGDRRFVAVGDNGVILESDITNPPAYNALYCFGDSWSDTHNCSWDSSSFWMDRASNGPLWPEYLSTNLGLAYVAENNYASCGASLSDELNQIDNQFQEPPEPAQSLYSLWLGFDPSSITNETAFQQATESVVASNLFNVQRLYEKGARSIILENQQDMSRFPASLVTEAPDTLSRWSGYTGRWNAACLQAVRAYNNTTPDLRVYWVDVFTKLDDVIANPGRYGFTKTDIDALSDISLLSKSFTGPGVDYVWWNPYHLTTKAHQLLAAWHLEVIRDSRLEQLAITLSYGSPVIEMMHLLGGRDYTLQQSLDLADWKEIQSFTATAGTNRWSGPVGNPSASYFRLQWRP